MKPGDLISFYILDDSLLAVVLSVDDPVVTATSPCDYSCEILLNINRVEVICENDI